MNPNMYKLMACLALYLGIYNFATAQCATGAYTTFSTADNPPNSGSQMLPAQCSFNYEICYDIQTFTEQPQNQLHGIHVFRNPDDGTKTVAMGAGGGEQPAVGGGYNWIFLDDTEIANGGFVDILGLPLTAGFYVDDGDGDPTNNLGDTGDGDCDGTGCTENFTTLAPFCFNIQVTGCTSGEYLPGVVVSGDGETGSNTLPNPVCYSFGYLPGGNPADELGPNCDGTLYYSTNPGVSNDLPSGAESLDAMISDAVNADHGWSCDATPRIFTSVSQIPRPSRVENDASGASICDNTDKNDRWFSFTGGEDVWLDVYRGSANPDNMVVALYSGTPTETGCEITGLTYLGCTDGDLDYGEPRDVSRCTTPSQERIDVSGLNAGQTYYLRVWQVGTALQVDSDFFICVEKSTPVAPGEDTCDFPGGPTIGCLSGIPNSNIVDSYTNLSNAGTFGNTQPGCDPNNGQAHGGAFTVSADEGCDGIWLLFNTFLNDQVNNNVIYSFEVNGSAECGAQASVQIKLDNMEICCGGGVFQLLVTPADCAVATPVLASNVNPANATCVILETPTGLLQNGTYVISIEGQTGKLIKYDLSLTVIYVTGMGCVSEECSGPLPVELGMFRGKNEGLQNTLEWMTLSESNTAWHILERSTDGTDFQELTRVEAAGESTTALTYNYTDKNAPKEAYYRLKVLDFDDKYQLSDIVYLYREAELKSGLELIPNPATGETLVRFELKKKAKTRLEMFDLTGHDICTIKATELEKGSHSIPLDVSQLENGIYFIRIYDGESYRVKRLIVDHLK